MFPGRQRVEVKVTVKVTVKVKVKVTVKVTVTDSRWRGNLDLS